MRGVVHKHTIEGIAMRIGCDRVRASYLPRLVSGVRNNMGPGRTRRRDEAGRDGVYGEDGLVVFVPCRMLVCQNSNNPHALAPQRGQGSFLREEHVTQLSGN